MTPLRWSGAVERDQREGLSDREKKKDTEEGSEEVGEIFLKVGSR